jgi:hypothetical protein
MQAGMQLIVFAGAWNDGVFEQAGVGDVEPLAVGRQRQAEWIRAGGNRSVRSIRSASMMTTRQLPWSRA